MKEMNVLYKCTWPDLRLFDVGEDVGDQTMVWHDSFNHDISQDRDLAWLEYGTAEGIRLQLNGGLLETCLSVNECAAHDHTIRQFSATQETHVVLGVFLDLQKFLRKKS